MSLQVYALDARNHGDSPHTADMDYLLMANDLELFFKEREVKRAALLGHSMGGRATMTFALTRVKNCPTDATASFSGSEKF